MNGQTTYPGINGQAAFNYNALGQMTALSTGAMRHEYTYSATANDGRVQGGTNVHNSFSRSTIAYDYDSLGRLSTANSTSIYNGPVWGQAFVYDPFGNLLQLNVTSGSAPALSLNVDPSTNRITGSGYDAAGNLTQMLTGQNYASLSYDSENRLSRFVSPDGSTSNYYYGANGERLFDGRAWYLYGPNGNRVRLTRSSTGAFVWSYDDLTFAGKQVVLHGRAVLTDRVGTVVGIGSPTGISSSIDDVGSGYPYGYIYPTASYSNPYEMSFATYENDGNGLYYAMNRYYDPARGRFTTPDPAASGTIARPNSWNQYAYTEGDPVNYNDPEGLFIANPWYGTEQNWMNLFLFWGGASTHIQPINTLANWDDVHPGKPRKPVGYAGARADLAKADCYKSLGFSSAEAAQSAFDKVTFEGEHLGQLQIATDANGHWAVDSSTQPPAQTFGNTVEINYDYNWLNFNSNSAHDTTTGHTTTVNYLASLNEYLGTSMTTGSLSNLILLHEFNHTSLGGNAPQEADPHQFNLDIFKNCIK